ncbi:MAG: hypothetical protein C4558_02115 [Dehalococcoidia bacterium]|nr:MAG: hypothetical protein C4558_02115 [Dehalococcoidia bacterium]
MVCREPLRNPFEFVRTERLKFSMLEAIPAESDIYPHLISEGRTIVLHLKASGPVPDSSTFPTNREQMSL